MNDSLICICSGQDKGNHIPPMPPISSPAPSLPTPELTGSIGRVFDLQGYSYAERAILLPALTTAFTHCGGWVLERRTTSPTTIEFRLELQLRAIVELYAALVAAGVELTSVAHDTLSGLCTCRRHGMHAVNLRQVLTLRLELSFLEDVTLHSLLMTGSGLA